MVQTSSEIPWDINGHEYRAEATRLLWNWGIYMHHSSSFEVLGRCHVIKKKKGKYEDVY